MLHFSVSFVLFNREVSCHLSPHPGHIEIEREILQLRLTAGQGISAAAQCSRNKSPLPDSAPAGVILAFL